MEFLNYDDDEDGGEERGGIAGSGGHSNGVDPALYLDELPPVTEGGKPETLALLAQYLEAQKEHGFDLTKSIQSKKDFGNPAILTKVVAYFEIDELGSNYPKHLFDPREVSDRNKQEPEERKRGEDRSTRASGAPVRFIQGAPEVPGSSLDDGMKKKKSRWAL